MPATCAPVRPMRPWVQRTRLGHPRRARREDEEVEVLVVRRRRRCRRSAVRRRAPCRGRRVDDEQPLVGHRRLDAVEEGEQVAGGDQRLAVGVVDQLGELLAAVGRVDADDDRARDGPGDQPQQVVGHVVEQDADVRRPVGVAHVGEPGGSPPALLDQLAVGPLPVLVEQGGAVRRRPGPAGSVRVRSSSVPFTPSHIDVNVEIQRTGRQVPPASEWLCAPRTGPPRPWSTAAASGSGRSSASRRDPRDAANGGLEGAGRHGALPSATPAAQGCDRRRGVAQASVRRRRTPLGVPPPLT